MAEVGDVALVRRELVSRVFRAVRDLGGATSLDDALQRITDAVVVTLDFAGAALNVWDPATDEYVVRAVTGPQEAQVLVGNRVSSADWAALLARCDRDGELHFLDHRQLDDPDVAAVPGWFPEATQHDLPRGVWHAGDSMLATVRDQTGQMLAVLSVDLPEGTVQDTDQRTALELFAAEAGKAILEWQTRRASERARTEAENRFRMVFDNGLVGAALLDASGDIVEINERAASMLGWTVAELQGRNRSEVIPPVNHVAADGRFAELLTTNGWWVQDRQLMRRDGEAIWTLMHASTVVEGDPPRQMIVVQFTDVTAQRRRAEELAHQLDHDPLTDLPNRRVLERRLTELFEDGRPFGVLYADVDGFKGVLDALGHSAADAVIVQIADRLRAAVPDDAVVVRLTGDEFVVVVVGVDDPDLLAGHAERLTAALAEAFDLDGVPSHLQISIGVSGTRDWHAHPVDVLREADEALQRAKRRGRARVELFDPGYDRPVTRADLELERDLRHAIEAGTGLEPHFQSVISLSTGGTVGYESLLRWRHPRLGVLLPDRFIPVADRAGLAAALGWRVLDLVAERIPPVTDAQRRPWIAVNVSAAQLGRGSLLDALRRVVDSTFRESPSDLHLEITETSLLDASAAVIDELYAAVELGARLSLDDFGTGYSSLTLLRDLPVSSIKIDRSFIAPIAVDIRARTIVQHTIELCQGLGMSTIAEGVETHEQLAWLQTLGCEYGQGFLIDRPNPWPRLDIVPPEERRRFEL